MAHIKACRQYGDLEANYEQFRVLLFQGGTRSGKTYSIITWLIMYAIRVPKSTINIFRKIRSTVASSILIDFKDVMYDLNMYDSSCYNKATMRYEFENGSSIQFMGCDDAEKVKGVPSTISYLNEVSSFYLEDYRQIAFRVKKNIIMDYNPNMPTYHFVFKEVAPRDDAVLFHSTYKDNPFLEQSQVNEIERYKETDENYWRIYGLGVQGVSKETIFPDFQKVTNYSEVDAYEHFGMDFGYNDPTTLVGIKVLDKEHKELYIKQYMYKTGLTANGIHDHLLFLNSVTDDVLVDATAKTEITYDNLITADSARPEIIEELVQRGWNVDKSKKGDGSVYAGILKIKQYKIFLDKGSAELIEEFAMYKWQKHKNGIDTLEKPEQRKDHLIDAVRYALENIDSHMPYFFGVA